MCNRVWKGPPIHDAFHILINKQVKWKARPISVVYYQGQRKAGGRVVLTIIPTVSQLCIR